MRRSFGWFVTHAKVNPTEFSYSETTDGKRDVSLVCEWKEDALDGENEFYKREKFTVSHIYSVFSPVSFISDNNLHSTSRNIFSGIIILLLLLLHAVSHKSHFNNIFCSEIFS